jgi:hypothetical protein
VMLQRCLLRLSVRHSNVPCDVFSEHYACNAQRTLPKTHRHHLRLATFTTVPGFLLLANFGRSRGCIMLLALGERTNDPKPHCTPLMQPL